MLHKKMCTIPKKNTTKLVCSCYEEVNFFAPILGASLNTLCRKLLFYFRIYMLVHIMQTALSSCGQFGAWHM